MPQRFNVGDRARRTRFSDPNYNYNPIEFGIIGGVYTVRESELGTVQFVEIRGRCSPSCFELVTEAEAPQAKAFFWLFVFKDNSGDVYKMARENEYDALVMKNNLEIRQKQGNITDLHMKKISINLSNLGGYDADI